MNLDRFIASHLSAPKDISGRIVSFFMSRRNRPIYKKTISILNISDGDNVLDIGCGNGYVLNIIAKHHKGNFAGIDKSESIIKAAKSRNRQFIKNGIMEFCCQDLSRMSFEDGFFDKVYTINTIYFWESLDDTFREINRVLKPNGIFINTVLSNETLDRFSFTKHGYKRFSEERLTGAGSAAGFQVKVNSIFRGFAYCYEFKKI